MIAVLLIFPSSDGADKDHLAELSTAARWLAANDNQPERYNDADANFEEGAALPGDTTACKILYPLSDVQWSRRS